MLNLLKAMLKKTKSKGRNMCVDRYSINGTRQFYKGYFLEVPRRFVRGETNVKYTEHLEMENAIKHLIRTEQDNCLIRIRVEDYNDTLLYHKMGKRPSLKDIRRGHD